MPRSRLGPLAIESKLGDQPSQSTVWRAIHVQHKKAVAVKVFAVPFGGTPEARKSFIDEWERLKGLQHPSIAKCFGGGFEETDAYLAYELVEGQTMAAQLERAGRMSWENALEIAQGLTEALEYLHSQQIAFGTLVPDKVMIAGLSPVLLDVRIDRLASPFRSARPPMVDELARQAPELIASAGHTTSTQGSSASDLYSLGALLYHAITGRLPISGESVEQIRSNAATEVPVSPSSIVLECPVWFDKLIMQLLEKNPAQRPVTAVAVRMALAEVRKRALSRSGVAEHVSRGLVPCR